MITKTDIADYIPLAANLDSTRVEMFAKEQEVIRLNNLLGREFYNDLVANPETAANAALIVEIKPMLVYWTYVKYLQNGAVFNTATGAVLKRTDYSIPMSDKELEYAVTSNVELARFYESTIIEFLKENKDDYPLFETGKKHTGEKILKISTT